MAIKLLRPIQKNIRKLREKEQTPSQQSSQHVVHDYMVKVMMSFMAFESGSSSSGYKLDVSYPESTAANYSIPFRTLVKFLHYLHFKEGLTLKVKLIGGVY